MSARFFIHLGFLLSALLLTIFWTKNPNFSFYTLQAIAFLVLFYFANHYLGKKNRYSQALDGLIFAMVTLLLVTQTGGLTSPLFFLFYILLFGLALFFEPLPTLIFSLALIIFFAAEVKNLNDIIQILSLVFIAPLALFFGKQYLELLEKEEKIKILKQEENQLTAEVGQQEEDTLLFLSLSFREQVSHILEASANMLADIGHLTLKQKENLEKIRESAKNLLKLGEKLKEKIED